MAAREGKVHNMAQTATRVIIRRNIRLAGGKHLIFDYDAGLWRIAFYRPRRDKEQGHELKQTLQEQMERAAMLPKMRRNFWCRFTTQAPTLRTGIYTVLEQGGYHYLLDDIVHYIEGMDFAWYLESS